MPVEVLWGEREEQEVDAAHLVDIGAGVIVRRQLSCRAWPDEDDDELPYEVTLTASYNEDGGCYEVERMDVARVPGGPPVTSHEMRSIPVAGLLRGISFAAVVAFARGPKRLDLEPPEMPNNELPRKLDAAAYRKIAIVHRVALLLGKRATQQVADHFGVSRSTAYSWIKTIESQGVAEPVWQPMRDEVDE